MGVDMSEDAAVYTARYDPEVARRILSRNRATVAVLCTVGVAGAALCAALAITQPGGVRLIVLAGVFAFVALFLVLPVMVGVGRKLAYVSRGSGTFVGVSPAGIRLPVVGEIAWEEVVGVVLFDDSDRIARRRRIPLVGWATRLSQRAGNGSRLLTLGLVDGARVRARIRDSATKRIVRLWGRDSDAVRPGDVSLLLDPVLSADEAQQLSTAIAAAAARAAVPVLRPANQRDYFRVLGRLVDPRWPAEDRSTASASDAGHDRLAEVGRRLFGVLRPEAELNLVPLPDGLGVCLVDASRGGGKIYVAPDETVLFVASALNFEAGLAAFREGRRTPPEAFDPSRRQGGGSSGR
jgi:hypothetical protein